MVSYFIESHAGEGLRPELASPSPCRSGSVAPPPRWIAALPPQEIVFVLGPQTAGPLFRLCGHGALPTTATAGSCGTRIGVQCV